MHKISVQNVGKVFPVKRGVRGTAKGFVALKGVTFTAEKGEFLSIVGPSGCGKSTLLDMLAGLSYPTSGSLSIDGKPVTGPALDRGIVFQGYALLPWRTVRKNIEFGLELKGAARGEHRTRSSYFIDLVGLSGFEDRFPHELSGGMKQRVAIARSFAYDPDVLLMDEPFAAVDAQTREGLQNELLSLWEKTGKTIVLVTHSIDEAVFLADRVIVMSSRPGSIRKTIKVGLPRPRRIEEMRDLPHFNRLKQEVWGLLEGEGPEAPGAREDEFRASWAMGTDVAAGVR